MNNHNENTNKNVYTADMFICLYTQAVSAALRYYRKETERGSAGWRGSRSLLIWSIPTCVQSASVSKPLSRSRLSLPAREQARIFRSNERPICVFPGCVCMYAATDVYYICNILRIWIEGLREARFVFMRDRDDDDDDELSMK